MRDLLIINLPLVAGGGLALLLVAFLMIWRSARAHKLSLLQAKAEKETLVRDLNKLNKQLLESRSILVGLGQRLSEQSDLTDHLAERIAELEQADTEGRLYSRATKMVQLGADIDELIEECELPKAEAELMFSLQQKLAGKESVPPLSKSEQATAVKTRRAAGATRGQVKR
jgi:hypothetical protein